MLWAQQALHKISTGLHDQRLKCDVLRRLLIFFSDTAHDIAGDAPNTSTRRKPIDQNVYTQAGSCLGPLLATIGVLLPTDLDADLTIEEWRLFRRAWYYVVTLDLTEESQWLDEWYLGCVSMAAAYPTLTCASAWQYAYADIEVSYAVCRNLVVDDVVFIFIFLVLNS